VYVGKPSQCCSPQFTRNISSAYFYPCINICQYFFPFCLSYVACTGLGALQVGSQFSGSSLRHGKHHSQQLEFIPKYCSLPLPQLQTTGKTEILPCSNGELCYKLITDSASVPAGLRLGIQSPLQMLLIIVSELQCLQERNQID